MGIVALHKLQRNESKTARLPPHVSGPPFTTNGYLLDCIQGVKNGRVAGQRVPSKQSHMTDTPHTPAAQQETRKPKSALAANLNTTIGSGIHYLDRCLAHVWPGKKWARLKLYLASFAITSFPLLIGAYFSPFSLSEPNAELKLPFLYDLNAMFMFLISFPFVVILTATDQKILTCALNKVQSDETIVIPDEDQNRLATCWTARFRNWNWVAQAAGLLVGGTIAYLNYRTYARPGFGFWITHNNVLLPVGCIYLYCILLFYAVVTIYVVRNFVISLLLRDVVAKGEIHMLPLHPDKAGGLLPVGRLGLRNQYALTVFGFNVVLMATISIHYFEVESSLVRLIVAAVVAYLLVGPVVFMAPLLPFRSAMLRNKGYLMSGVAQQLRAELNQLRLRLPKERISKEEAEFIERLQKIGIVIDELPVWPFDAVTLRKFFTAYVIPIVSAGYPIAKAILGAAKVHLPFF
jgi:hypothetical protein